MGITVYSLLWVMQDFDHQQYQPLQPQALHPRRSVCGPLRPNLSI